MRVCPKCGHKDPLIWRHKNRRYDVDYCRFDEFAELHPELAKQLKKGHQVVTDDTFAYRRCGRWPKINFWVERIWVELYNWGGVSGFRMPMEKHKLIDPFQRRLLEDTQTQP